MDPLARLFLRYRDHGDVQALGEVFDAVAPRLLALSLHLCGNGTDAEDALQQTFVQAMRLSASFDATRRLEPWLAGLLANLVRNGRRRDGYRRATELPEIASGDDGPMAAAERGELIAALRTHVTSLPSEQRQVLLLQLQHGLSPAEIAEVLEVPPGTVRMRLHRGLSALRRILPAGFAGWLFGSLTPRGIAAVRREVLSFAGKETVAVGAGTAVAAIGGVLVMKKIVLACAAMLVAGLLWWWSGAPGAAAAPSPGSPRSVDPAVAAIGERREPSESAAEPSQRVAVAAATGSLRVRVHARESAAADAVVIPVDHAPLQVWAGGSELLPFYEQENELRTDADGSLVLDNLVPGPWQVLLETDRDGRPVSTVVEAGKQAEVEIAWPTARVVRGQVVDTDGQAVAGAEIWAYHEPSMGRYDLPESQWLALRRAALSDGAGLFTVPLTQREGPVGASKAGYVCSHGAFSGGSEVRFVLGRNAAVVSGTVRDANGQAVRDARITVHPAGQDTRRMADGTLLLPRIPMMTRTDAMGAFTLDGLPPGKQKVWVWSPPHYGALREIDLICGATLNVDFVLPDAVTVVGTVFTEDGQPAAHLGVAARASLDPNGHYCTCETRADGSFVLSQLPTKHFVVTVGGGRGSQLLASRVFDSMKPGVLHCDLTLEQFGRQQGRVVDEAGAPLVGWNILAKSAIRETWRRSGVDGRFELLLHKDEKAHVVAYALFGEPGHPAAERPDVQPGGDAIEFRIPAAAIPSAVLRGRLVDVDGAAFGDRALEVSRVRDRWEKVGSGATASDGAFRFGPLGPGDYQLNLPGWSDEQRRELTKFTVRAQETIDLGNLVLPRPATLLVELQRDDGTAWSGPLPWVNVLNASGKRILAFSETAGSLRGSVEAGHYRVEVGGEDLVAKPHEIDVVAGQSLTVHLAVAIGRTRRLVFNGDGADKPDYPTPLHVQVRGRDGVMVVNDDDVVLYPDLRGFRYWYVDRAFPFGNYEVTANTDAGRRYRATFEVRDNLDDATRVDVPVVQ